MIQKGGGYDDFLRSRDDIAMEIYFSASDGQRRNYALLGYLCACSQNFDFTTGNVIYFYNLLRTTLDDAVINDSGRKGTLSIDLNISKLILLWTASIIMIAAFVLYLSTTTSATIKVGMKGISTGLVEVFGMFRANLLISEHERASLARLSTVLTALSDMGGMETHVNRILYMTSLSLTCSSYDSLSGHVFQCLVRSSMDHRAESHRVCSGASVVSIYGQQSRLHACASLSSSHIAWSSRTCLPLS